MFGYAMVDLAAISFLGLGVQPPRAELGRHDLGEPGGHPAGLPAARRWSAVRCIVVVVIAVNVLGERLFEQAQRTHR